MKKLKYETIDSFLSSSQAQDKGEYYICNCPSCNEKEAFFYKGSNFLNCNRENECGDTFILDFQKDKKVTYKENYKTKKTKTYDSLFNFISNAIDFDTHKNGEFSIRKKNYRGLSNPPIYDFNLDELTKESYENKLEENKLGLAFKDYNLIMPIFNGEKLERVLFRSSKELDKSKPKEKQLKISNEARDFYLSKLESKTIFITEGLIDGFSIEEVAPDVGIISLTGCKKTSNFKKYISNNLEKFKDKDFVIAFDNDNAGIKASEKLFEDLEKLDLSVSTLTPNSKDLNDELINNKSNLLNEINKKKEKEVKEMENIKYYTGFISIKATKEQFENEEIDIKKLSNEEKIKVIKKDGRDLYAIKMTINYKKGEEIQRSPYIDFASYKKSDIEKYFAYQENKIPVKAVTMEKEWVKEDKSGKNYTLLAIEDKRKVSNMNLDMYSKKNEKIEEVEEVKQEEEIQR